MMPLADVDDAIHLGAVLSFGDGDRRTGYARRAAPDADEPSDDAFLRRQIVVHACIVGQGTLRSATPM
jgi:hypothetical protein